jgi:hypothetical protein
LPHAGHAISLASPENHRSLDAFPQYAGQKKSTLAPGETLPSGKFRVHGVPT